MASGDSLLVLGPLNGYGPDGNFATFVEIAGGQSERVPALAFDDTTNEFVDFHCVMPEHYGGGGLTLTVIFAAAAATGVVRWEAGFQRWADDTVDIGGAHPYAYNHVEGVVPSAVDEVAYDDITFTDGADMGSVVAGDAFLLRFRRQNSGLTGTNLTGDARLLAIHVKET